MESEVLNVLLDHVMICSVTTVSHIPRSVRPLLAHVLSIEFQKACTSVWGFVRLFIFAKVVLYVPSNHSNRRRRCVISSVLLDRLHMWSLSNGVNSLWSLLQDDLKVSKPAKPASSDEFSKHRALFWAREGRYSNALQALNSVGVAGHDDEGAFQDLLKRHPHSSCPTESSANHTSFVVDESMVLSCLHAFPKGTSPGASKLRAQHLLDAVAGSTAPAARECLASLTRFMNHLLSGRAPSCLAPWLCGAPLTALLKKGGGVRPIAVGEVLRRLASRLCCLVVRPSLPSVFLPYGQVGVGIQGGLEGAIHITRHFISAHSDDDSFALLKVDMKNAFNECDRSAFFTRVSDDFPEISAWVKWCYSQPAELRFGNRRLLASSGVQQGDPLGPLLFSLVILQFIDAVNLRDYVDLNLWYLDDGTLVGKQSSLSTLLSHFSTRGPEFGLHLNLSKCELFWPSGDSFPNFPTDIKRVKNLELLGSPLWGDDAFFSEFISSCSEKVAASQEKLSLIDDPQVELHLLRSCLSSCKVIHLLRTVPFTILKPLLYQFDHNLRSCLGRIMQCSLSDASWQQASLPFRLGGLGLRESTYSAFPAFLGSCNGVRELASIILSIDINQLSFPNEKDAATFLSDFFDNHSLFTASQRDLQATLDQHLFDNLFKTFCIRDQARLTALSHPSGTSSGWLKAIPRVSLGLAIPGPEFVVGLRIWLGVSLFPLSPLCTCLSTIDNFGDHLLGCSQGPMRIRRHDALVNIVYNALAQDHPGVLKEQRASYDDGLRPGDVFHPDYQHGRPAYFDISVRSTTQPSFVSSSASCAGVAAAAGEVAKDEKHLAAVEKVGSDFIPLVVETFGVWTQFALKTLYTIADRTTPRSGVPRKVARRNLLQQLLVQLWTNNSRMILRYWALQDLGDDDTPFSHNNSFPCSL